MTSPVRFLAFDLLQFGTKSLLREPCEQRRCLLAGVAMPDPHQISALRGFTFTELAADRRTRRTCSINVAVTGHESLVAKLLLAPDVPGRSPDVLVQARPGAGQNRLNGNVGGLLLGSHDRNTPAIHPLFGMTGCQDPIGDECASEGRGARLSMAACSGPVDNGGVFASFGELPDVARGVFVVGIGAFASGELVQAFRRRRGAVLVSVRAEVVFRAVFLGAILLWPIGRIVVPAARIGGGAWLFTLGTVVGWLGLLLRWWSLPAWESTSP